jgi:tetratricopeptide (TPR) repeat protein
LKKQQQMRVLCWLSLLFLTLPRFGGAQGVCDPVAQLVSAQGEVRINGSRIDNAAASKGRQNVCAGDLISVGGLSRASIAILDTDTVVRIDQNTELRLHVSPIKDPSFLELLKGAINILSPAPRELEVKTAFVNAAVEGTEFHIRVEDDYAVVTVLEGKVRASNDNGSISLTSDQSARAHLNTAPTLDLTVVPDNAVQWALYYAPVVDHETAIAGLTENDPRFHTRQAAQALSVGAVDQAKRAIDAALDLDGDNAEAWALQLIIAVTQNNENLIGDALQEAQTKVLTSAAALVALSYAQQSRFDLHGALESLKKAVEIDADNVLARARLAEILLSLGYVDEAVKEAERADMRAANARSKTVLGFAYLANIKVSLAAAAFHEAIGYSSEDPLVHLGLGLAKIRSGDLIEGRRDIEIAADLDRNNALIRSYLGKAFYEEKRGPLDEAQYLLAKRLDPNDPTPWFYDAIRKQTINQPVGALHDLKTSIELNDNRAVFRSRLMLDEDLAARSASLGRIYRDLGFEQLALVEGWKSVGTDPANHSGHRFLADTYSSLPRHEIARVNELYRSQLLQPINITPIQPQLGELNLFILDTAGPAEIAFNEFNPLFNRNGFAIQGSAVYGGNDTVGGDIVLSGLSDRWSYSLGAFHFETDGFRENNDFRQDVLNAFVQFRPTFKTSFQAEIRTTETEKGDLALLFDPADFIPVLRQEDQVDSARLGFRHAFSNRSDLLGSFMYQSTDSLTDLVPSALFDIELDSYQTEFQHLYRAENWRITSGVSYRQNDQSDVTTFAFPNPFPPPPVFEMTSTDSVETDFATGYIYAQLNHVEQLSITLGGSLDSLDGRFVDRDKFNPKFGVIWEPRHGTTLRAAAFKTLQGPIFSKRNIQPRLEPTQVAGFNQFFFGTEGEEVFRWGLGIDQRMLAGVFAGAEYSQRDLDVPVLDPFSMPGLPPTVDVVNIEEETGRAYVYWTTSDDPEENDAERNSEFSLSAEYLYESFDNNGQISVEQFTKLRTHRFPLHVNYFHKSGLSAGLEAVYVDQKGTFPDLSAPPGPFPVFLEGEDSFWVFGASLGYRMPKRYGVIAVKVNNLFDQEFRFQDTDPENPRILPERLILLNITLAY